MKRFFCRCGGEIFFDNTVCLACQRELGFDPVRMTMLALPLDADDSATGTATPTPLHCRNRIEYSVCNWFATGQSEYCLACATNEVIPNLDQARSKELWFRLEQAKRRLVYSILSLKLPLHGAHEGKDLKFHFLEDQRQNPNARLQHVNTGHRDGIITINVAEADTMARHKMRQLMRERYRTLLGHFRHESGHYYFKYLVPAGDPQFRTMFGDPDTDYAATMKSYYQKGAPADWSQSFISAYASSHPWEDWAEIFAHYLHITDALETWSAFLPDDDDRDWIAKWIERSIGINEISHSLGVDSPYPFFLNEATIEKLRYVDERIHFFKTRATAAIQ